MNIVFLTGPFYPDMSPVSACVNKYIQELKKRHSVDIICERNRYDISGFTDNDIKLHQVANWWMKLRVFCEYNIKNDRYVFFYSFIRFLLRAYGVIISPFCYPTRMSWLINCYVSKFEELNKTKKIDVVISSHYPICTMFAGLKIKQKYHDVKWITYFTDPFSCHPPLYKDVIFKRHRRLKNQKAEELIYNTADFNIFTEELYNYALNEFSFPRKKAICFPFIVSNIREDATGNRVEPTEKTRFVYAGRFYKDIRNPEYMLSVISQVKNMQLDIFKRDGDCDDIIGKYLSENIKAFPTANRNKYINLICNEYDILLSIGNNCELQAPSKTLELLSTGLPIIHFYYKEDSQYELIKRYPLGLVIKNGTPDVLDKINEFCKRVKGKSLTFKEIESIYTNNSLKKQITILESLFYDK